ncbi:MAG: MBL fold metallo-hydrolase [Planctomycetota bacterium]
MPALEFFGAAQTVTGSMHILHLPDGPFALDCGLFQGHRIDAETLNRRFPVRPDKLRGVLLSHAHIDHSGKAPLLCKQSFDGRIHATNATVDLCEVMLADSGHIHEEDARYWNKKRARREEDKIKPLYTVDDARTAQKFFAAHPYNEPFEFAPGCTARFLEAGHILGSACVLVEVDSSPKMRLLYTGDLGRFDMPILRDPACPLPPVDYLITESTYANRSHDNPTDMKRRLTQVINETRALGGKVIIPAFSVGRTQNLVYYLSQAMFDGTLDPLPVYVDSPLSTNVTEVFRKHTECYDEAAREFWQQEGTIFGHGRITYITDVESSKRLNDLDEPCVIISASGMCETGRILHHLKNNIEKPENTVVVVGFMAQHTLGRRLMERRPELKIYGMMYKLLCRVEVLNGFSAHADSGALTRCLTPLAKDLKAAFCVHGENGQPEAMRDILREAGCKEVLIPQRGQKYQF